MKTYFLKLHFYQSKNKAETAIKEFVNQFDNSVMDRSGIDQMCSQIYDKVEEVNKEFKRCRNLDFRTYKLDDNNARYGQYLASFDCVIINATTVESYSISNPIQP